MKKNISLLCTKIIYLVIIVATIITCFIVYKDIDNKVAIGFVVGYIIFIVLISYIYYFYHYFQFKKIQVDRHKKKIV